MIIDIDLLIETTSKKERQSHLNLIENCFERGGNSTNHRGVLAQYLNTNIPKRTVLLCHACNNPKCSNPKHLYWGTPRENIQDSIDAGTWWPTRNNFRTKFVSEETKRKISAARKGKVNNPLGINGVKK